MWNVKFTTGNVHLGHNENSLYPSVLYLPAITGSVNSLLCTPECNNVSVPTMMRGFANSKLNQHKAKQPAPMKFHQDYLGRHPLRYPKPLTMVHVFEASPKQGKVPEEWKTFNSMPFFKKGVHQSTTFLVLSSVCSEVMEHILVVHSTISTHIWTG